MTWQDDAAMPTADDLRALVGRTVSLRLTPAGGGGQVDGRVVGTLDAADGMVVVLAPGDGAKRVSINYQHVDEVLSEGA